MNILELDRDPLFVMALSLNPKEIANLCKTNSKFNRIICNNNLFWMNKLNKDYPYTIGKFTKDADFKKIYISLFDNKTTYFSTMISTKNKNDIPKIYSYIKPEYGTEGIYGYSTLTDEDFDLAEAIYPDFNERSPEDLVFYIKGVYPKGTEMFLTYCDDRDFRMNIAYLSKDQAIDKILVVIRYILGVAYSQEGRFTIQEQTEKTAEEIYGGTYENAIKNCIKQLNDNDLALFDYEMDKPITFIIKKLVVVDYHKIVEELNKTNPLWRKLPKDMLNYILKMLEERN